MIIIEAENEGGQLVIKKLFRSKTLWYNVQSGGMEIVFWLNTCPIHKENTYLMYKSNSDVREECDGEW